jgi:surface antigen
MMKKVKSTTTVVLASTLGLSACAGGGPTGEDIGFILGTVGGAYLGSQFGSGSGRTAMTVLGATLGGYAGKAVARRLTQRDYEYMDQAAYEAVSTGQPSTWQNEESGNFGSAAPTNSYARNGQNCTNFSQSVTSAGETASGTSSACQLADGSWQIMS